MGFLDAFQDAYYDLEDIVKRAKEAFGCDFVEVSIKMDADIGEEQVSNPKVVAVLSGKDFVDWEAMGMWIDEKDGELLDIDVYDDGMIITRILN